MKKILIAIFAIAAISACNKADVIEVNKGEAIEFGNVFVDNSTKADPSYSAKDIEKFSVYGTVNNVVIYPGTEVSKTSYGSAWNCGVEQYWIPGAAYKFVGIVDGNVTGVTTTTLTDNMPTSINYKADGKTDLLCQTITKTANTDGTSNGLVAFTFSHLLSKVNFAVTNKSKDAANYSFVVKNITFTGNVEGNYDVATATWKNFTTGTTKFNDITIEAKAESAQLVDEVLLLPGDVSISFTVDILCNGTVITSTNYPTTGTYTHTLTAANAYNFNIEVSVGEKIEFTVTKKPEWLDNSTVTLQ